MKQAFPDKSENSSKPMGSTDDRELRMTWTIRAPIDLVWKIWSIPGHIAKWWGPAEHTTTIHIMDFKEGGEWRLTIHGPDGKNYPNRSIFREVIPQQKIRFEHSNPHFMATVVFKPKGDETEIEWTSLFDTAEYREIIIKTFKADEGQKQNFEKMEAYLFQIKDVL